MISYNNSWMVFNALLAVLAVLLGYFMLLAKTRVLHILFGIFWFIFLPNTIYIYTDLTHLITQLPQVSWLIKPVILMQYIVLLVIGIITFILGYRPFEIWLANNKKLNQRRVEYILFFNLVMTFGIILGRVERVNSWEIVSNPLKVFFSSVSVFTSIYSLGLLILLWIVVNCIYFLFRKPVLALAVKSYHSINGRISHFSIDK